MIVQLQWSVATLTSLLAAGYDQQIVQRLVGVVWTNLTRSDQRLPLLSAVERYCLEFAADPLPLAAALRVVPARSSDGTLGTTLTDVITVTRRGYATVADVRAEGYLAPSHPDARVQDALDYATDEVDRACGQRFDAHYRRVLLDVDRADPVVYLDQAYCALWRCWDATTLIDRSDLVIYNRHLTHGLRAPDDRRNPRLSRTGTVPLSFSGGTRQLEVEGVWGYTDPDGLPGETVRGSQVPLSYGTTPRAIRRACLLLAVDRLTTLAAGGESATTMGRIISETTRDQSYTLAAPAAGSASWGLTGRAEVDALLLPYRVPASLGAI